jgi:aryl-alcohol dehydrogenase-like predicted oxidoreductase
VSLSEAMELRALGKTGLEVSQIGLGLAALGRPGYINIGHGKDLAGQCDEAAMEEHAHAVLRAAYDHGVRYFDVARSYGLGEKFLGTWLKTERFDRGNVTVGSKWGYTYTANWKVRADLHEVKDHSLPVLRRQWAESSSLLKSFLHIYQIHSASTESGVLENTEVLDELARLKSTGVRIGLSLTGPRQAESLHKAMEIQINGAALFDTVQATWNLLEQSAGPALLAASRAGLGVIIKEALANGRLTERNTEPEFRAKLDALKREATKLQTTVDVVALAVCLAQPFADVVLSGATTITQLQSNLCATALKLSEASRQWLSGFVEPPETYWAIRKTLAWN